MFFALSILLFTHACVSNPFGEPHCIFVVKYEANLGFPTFWLWEYPMKVI